MKKLNCSTDDKCKACGAREDRYHLLRCGHDSRIEWRRALILELCEVIEKLNTDFILSNAIADSITQWLDKGIVRSGDFPPAMRYAVDAQNKICYINLFCGKLSIHWLEFFDKLTPESSVIHQDS